MQKIICKIIWWNEKNTYLCVTNGLVMTTINMKIEDFKAGDKVTVSKTARVTLGKSEGNKEATWTVDSINIEHQVVSFKGKKAQYRVCGNLLYSYNMVYYKIHSVK